MCLSLIYLGSVLILMQPRILLSAFAASIHCLLLRLAVSTSILQSFPAELLPGQSVPGEYSCKGFFLARHRTLHLFLFDFLRFLVVHPSNLYRFFIDPFGWQPCHWAYSLVSQLGVIHRACEQVLCHLFQVTVKDT